MRLVLVRAEFGERHRSHTALLCASSRGARRALPACAASGSDARG